MFSFIIYILQKTKLWPSLTNLSKFTKQVDVWAKIPNKTLSKLRIFNIRTQGKVFEQADN